MTTEQATRSTLVAIRAAHHPEATPAFDRVVFQFDGPIPLVCIEYVDALISDGTGYPVAIAGDALVSVQFNSAYAHNEAGESTAPSRVKLRLPLVREIVGSGDFEAVVTYGVGLARKAELRVMTLANASRVVVDFMAR